MEALVQSFSYALSELKKVTDYLLGTSLSKQEMFVSEQDEIENDTVSLCREPITDAANDCVIEGQPYTMQWDVKKSIIDNGVKRQVLDMVPVAVGEITGRLSTDEILKVYVNDTEYYYKPEAEANKAMVGIETPVSAEYKAILDDDYKARTEWIDNQVSAQGESVQAGDIIPASLANRIKGRAAVLPLGEMRLYETVPDVSVLSYNPKGRTAPIIRRRTDFRLMGGRLYCEGALFVGTVQVNMTNGYSWANISQQEGGYPYVSSQSSRTKTVEIYDTYLVITYIIAEESQLEEIVEAGTMPDGEYYTNDGKMPFAVIVTGGVVTEKTTGEVLPSTTEVWKITIIPEQTGTTTDWMAEDYVTRSEILPYTLKANEEYSYNNRWLVTDYFKPTIQLSTMWVYSWGVFMLTLDRIAAANGVTLKTTWPITSLQNGYELTSQDGVNPVANWSSQVGFTERPYVANGTVYPAAVVKIFYSNGNTLHYFEGVAMEGVGKNRGLKEYVVARVQ